MSTANTNFDSSSPRVCPVTDRFQAYSQSFRMAARHAADLELDLKITLNGGDARVRGFTLNDLKAIDEDVLGRLYDDLEDLKNQVDYVLEILGNVIDLRRNPDAVWPS